MCKFHSSPSQGAYKGNNNRYCIYVYICVYTHTYIYFIGNYVLYMFIHLNSQQPYKGEGNVLHGWITEVDQGQLAVGGAKAVRPRRCDSSALNLYSLFTMSTNGENTF